MEDLHENSTNNKYKKWITFFRRNPHRFIETYFGIKLFPYQIYFLLGIIN
jgi:hypothetical protein